MAAVGSPATPSFPAPNAEVPKQVKKILKGDWAHFAPLPANEQYKVETKTSRTWALVATGFAASTVAAFLKINKYVALGLAAATVFSALQVRQVKHIPTEAYTRQCDEIKAIFKGVAQELRTSWEVASGLIAGVVTTKEYKTVDEANNATPELVQTYLKGTWFTANDPFSKVEDVQKPWRAAFQVLHPNAVALSQLKLGDLSKDMHPVLLSELTAVCTEATRVVNGKAPAGEKPVYVENKLVGKDAEAKVVSTAWKVKA